MNENYAVKMQSSEQIGGLAINPTLRENIDRKIQYHKDEIIRLEAISVSMSSMLDVNLRDLREAMSF